MRALLFELFGADRQASAASALCLDSTTKRTTDASWAMGKICKILVRVNQAEGTSNLCRTANGLGTVNVRRKCHSCGTGGVDFKIKNYNSLSFVIRHFALRLRPGTGRYQCRRTEQYLHAALALGVSEIQTSRGPTRRLFGFTRFCFFRYLDRAPCFAATKDAGTSNENDPDRKNGPAVHAYLVGWKKAS
jgi:hypothetical protein